MTIDKSLRQHYAMQGKVKNYLGKQKMVKAPKYWLSEPGHVKAKLAYITDEEEQILIDKNLYGSLRGRPNKGPAGLPSLQGGDYGSGGGRSSSGGEPGGGGHHHRDPAPAPAPAPAPSPHRDDSAERAAQAAADALNAQRAEAERANQLAEARRLMTQPVTVDVPIKGPELIPGTTGPFVADPYQQNYISPGEVYFKDRYQTGDYADLVKSPVDVGFQEALRKQQIATDLRQKQQDPDYGQFFRQPPVVEKSSGIMGTVKDTATQMAKNFAKQKTMKALGLSALNPYLGVGNWLLDKFAPGKKAALKSNITNLLTRKSDDLVGTSDWQGEQKRNKTFHEGKGDGQQVTTVQEDIAGKTPLGADALGLPELQKRMATLHQLKQNEDFWNQLTDIQKRNINMAMMDYFKLIDQYSVKPNEGRSRDI